MVIDSSALLAILQDEPERRAMIEAIEGADRRCLSVVNLVEASIVIETRRGPAAARLLDALVERAGMEVIGVDLEQGALARSAFARYVLYQKLAPGFRSIMTNTADSPLMEVFKGLSGPPKKD